MIVQVMILQLVSDVIPIIMQTIDILLVVEVDGVRTNDTLRKDGFLLDREKKLVINTFSILLLFLLIANLYSTNTMDEPLPIIPIFDSEYFPNLINLISKADSSIFISMYVVGNPGWRIDSIFQLIRDRAKRGVSVKIILDDNIESNRFIMNELRGIDNIDVKLDSPAKTTHNKIVIIDGKTTYIGSTNWTERSLGKANEANVIIHNGEIAQYYLEYLNKLWEDSSEDIAPFKEFTGNVIPLLDRQYYDLVRELIHQAKERVHVMVYGFKLTYQGNSKGDTLAYEIIDAKKRGVDTKVNLNYEGFSQKMNEYTKEYLSEFLVDVSVQNPGEVTHSKVVIIDNVLILGATNWSYGGLEEWHNTDVMIKDSGIVGIFTEYFNSIFEYQE